MILFANMRRFFTFMRLIQSSFLTDPVKQVYENHYLDRLKMLNT